jgi:hypothetical protein
MEHIHEQGKSIRILNCIQPDPIIDGRVVLVIKSNISWGIASNHDVRSGSNADSTLRKTLLAGPRTPSESWHSQCQ